MDNRIKIASGFQTYRFFDENDNLITSFVVNPADIGLLARCEEVAAYFAEHNDLSNANTAKEFREANNAIEKQIDYLLGLENDTVFKKPLTATTIMPDGRIFAEVIVQTVVENIKPELEKRTQAKKEHMDKYLSKYNR